MLFYFVDYRNAADKSPNVFVERTKLFLQRQKRISKSFVRRRAGNPALIHWATNIKHLARINGYK